MSLEGRRELLRQWERLDKDAQKQFLANQRHADAAAQSLLTHRPDCASLVPEEIAALLLRSGGFALDAARADPDVVAVREAFRRLANKPGEPSRVRLDQATEAARKAIEIRQSCVPMIPLFLALHMLVREGIAMEDAVQDEDVVAVNAAMDRLAQRLADIATANKSSKIILTG